MPILTMLQRLKLRMRITMSFNDVTCRIRTLSWIAGWLVVSGASSSSLAEETATVDFARDVRPILSDRCFQCHGPDAEHREADLRFDVEEGAKADLGGYRAIVAGDVEASALVERIRSSDPYEVMPPAEIDKPLTEAEKQTLERWIEQGARWSEHWAYVPPQEVETPEIANHPWPLNWIDHFVLERLINNRRKPSPEADRRTLARRLHLDLTGLPPTPERVEQFTADQRPEAYEQLVDELLASPHFGERMAVYWLDLVRYADTVGYHGDQDHNISLYRDYVIDAFNRNLPFDQFTREQLAGDLLQNPTIDQRVATGYNRLLQTSHEGGVQPKEYLAIYAADRVRNVSAVWMGATLGCAQCHDHKYDPYTAKDFYSMAAFFADVDEAQHFRVGSNALPTKRPPEIEAHSRLERETIEEVEARLSQLEQLPEAERSEAIEAELKELKSRRMALKLGKRKTMVTVSLEEPRTMRLLPRGNWLDESGPIVEPAIPEFMGELPVEGRPTRLDLANWFVDTEHGSGLLTARVMANRFWYLAFGAGLSRSLDDFGGQGRPPEMPELLDRLAIEFAQDWDVKRFMKTLVMSRTYRQSSLNLNGDDPSNLWMARQNRFRLPAELVRDAALSVSGLLVDNVGGMSVKPYQPAGYYRHLNFPQRRYQHDRGNEQWRRGVYVHWQRQFVHPTFRALDAPTREECTAQRATSNTPLAALALLNDPSFVEAARAFAQRVIRAANDDRQRVEFAYQLALTRPADPHEIEVLAKLLESNRQRYQADPEAAKQLLSVGLAPLPDDLNVVELATWTSTSRALLNLHEFMTRN